MIDVKNVSRGPQPIDGGGVLAHEETGRADDTPHTQAQLDAGLLLEMPKVKRSNTTTTSPPAGEEE